MLTVQQAANFLKTSEKSIRRYIKAGRLRARLVNGAKGEEYRIEEKNLNQMKKPERGRKPYQKNKAIPVRPTLPAASSMPRPIKEIMAESPPPIAKRNEETVIDYRSLYHNLFIQYEQALIMIGSLEAQLTSLNKALAIQNEYASPIPHWGKQDPDTSLDGTIDLPDRETLEEGSEQTF
ncbi:helix-turn-helix domain-containing protein [Candidatus Microgenomates bacterium]|nr:helix-turn-helix domain-containing protein [Candidatus Microgenomates bacterium]